MKYQYQKSWKNGRIERGTVIPGLIIWVLTGAFAVLFIYALAVGVHRQDLVTCHNLQAESQTYVRFFLTKGEKQMCDDLGVVIVAPVR